MNNRDLEKKINMITSELLRKQGYISMVDVFVGLGYLASKDVEAWRMKRIPYLERCIHVNLSKISFIVHPAADASKGARCHAAHGQGRKQHHHAGCAAQNEAGMLKIIATLCDELSIPYVMLTGSTRDRAAPVTGQHPSKHSGHADAQENTGRCAL